MNQTPSHHSHLLYITTGAITISLSGIWVAWSSVTPAVSAFYRVFLGTFFLLICCGWNKQFARVDRVSAVLMFFCGLSFSLDLLCWHASIEYIGPGLATVIGNFQVFILALVSILFFDVKLTVRFVFSLPLAIIGLLLVVGFDIGSLPPDYQFGLLLALATAVFYAAFILCLRQVQVRRPNLSFFFVLMLISAASTIMLFPVVLISGSSFEIPSFTSLGALVGLALFSQTIGWALISKSLPKIAPSLAGLILLLQPALAFVWDYLLLARPTTPLNWIGLFIVLTAIYLGMGSSKT